MENTTVYPHIKVFVDVNNEIHLVSFAYADKSGHLHKKHIGTGLIDFITLDFKEYEKELFKAHAMLETEYDYQEMRNLIIDIAEMLKDKHEYVYFFLTGALNKIIDDIMLPKKLQIQKCIQELFEVINLGNVFDYCVSFCLDAEKYQQRSMAEKFALILEHKYTKYRTFVFKTGTQIMPVYKGKLDYELVKEINKKGITDMREMLKVMHNGQKGVNLMGCTIIETLEEMLWFEFIELLKQGLQVKKCKLCNRYFILTSNRRTDFCDRVCTGKRTCKQVGGKKFHTKRVIADSVLRDYERIYKRYFARGDKPFEKKPDSKFYGQTFTDWVKMAKELRKKYKSGEISGDEFMHEIEE